LIFSAKHMTSTTDILEILSFHFCAWSGIYGCLNTVFEEVFTNVSLMLLIVTTHLRWKSVSEIHRLNPLLWLMYWFRKATLWLKRQFFIFSSGSKKLSFNLMLTTMSYCLIVSYQFRWRSRNHRYKIFIFISLNKV